MSNGTPPTPTPPVYPTKPFLKTVRFRVHKILKERKMSIKQLVEMSGLYDGTVRQIVKNHTSRIDTTTLAKICVALDVEISDVLVLASVAENNQ